MDRVVGLGFRTGRVESQRRFAVGPEVRPYPGAEGQSPNAMGPWYKIPKENGRRRGRRRYSLAESLVRAP